MASNRKITDKQFAPATSIDANIIDQALENAFDTQNNVEQIDGSWMPVNYVAHWSPARSHWRAQNESTANSPMSNQTRIAPNIYGGTYEHYFPFLNSRNWNDETYPRIRSNDEALIKNEYRTKGFSIFSSEMSNEAWCRGLLYATQTPASKDPADTGIGTSYPAPGDDLVPGPAMNCLGEMAGMAGVGVTQSTRYSPQDNKHMSAEMSYYFSDPVIISSVNMVAAQEHPISYYSSALDLVGAPNSYYAPAVGGGGFKIAPLQAIQYDYTTQMCTDPTKFIELTVEGAAPETMNMNETGAEFVGAESTNVGGDGFLGSLGNPSISVQVLIDNEFNSEVRVLTNVAYQIRRVAGTHQFNSQFPTSNSTAAPQPATVGQNYVDMTPTYPGGATWGVFILAKDLNIPVPRDSRVRFVINVKGFQSTQVFEWNSNLTVLERVE